MLVNLPTRYYAKRLSLLIVLSLLLHLVSPFIVQNKAEAVLTKASIRLTRMGASVAASASNTILVVIQPATAGTEALVELQIPDITSNGFTVDTGASAITHTTSGLPSTYQGTNLFSMTSMTGSATAGDAGANSTVQFTTGNLDTTTLYGFFITGGITNPTSGNAGTKVIDIHTRPSSSGSAIDSQSVAVDTVGTNGDQVALSASVPATFNFALSANTIALGTLSTGARTTGSVTVDVDTNGNNGWVAYIRSENSSQAGQELDSASTSDTISSTDTSACVTATIGAKGYVVDVNASAGSNGGGSLTVATEYDCTDDQAGGVIATSYEQIAQRTGVVDSDTLTLEAIVTISATTKAATDYADTWEVIGAGVF